MLWDSQEPQWHQTHAETLKVVFCIIPVFLRKLMGSGALVAHYRDASDFGVGIKDLTNHYLW